MIIECTECAKEVSNIAVSCPGCGYPIADMAKKAPTDTDSMSAFRQAELDDMQRNEDLEAMELNEKIKEMEKQD